MARRTAESADDAGHRSDLLPDGLPGAETDTRSAGARARWRVLAIVLALVVGAGVLIGGVVALVVRVGVGSSAQDSAPGASVSSSSLDGSPVDPAVAAVVADFETFARGLDGVSDADGAVSVDVAGDSAGGVPRGAAEVLLAGDGWEQADALAAALTGWTSAAEAEGRVVLDVRLTTADGSVELSRDGSANAPRLAVVHAVAGDDEVDTFSIGSSRVDLILVPGAAQAPALERWRALVAEIAPTMAVTVRSAETS
ncbi:hypothetical protein SAMN05216410_2474 [Sanguibacter gelidistatuariae]|uniref:Uncharacterized protein n=1 Tax=Sanguibacter gelidistatuariae TaxID=1814289 RepID=A0A1G6Q8G4_9MICO|nr:hypothetical protein [Sanguibacter gelidistatuariae]SDC88792.1 hypothetical protein SAMN05216410_2474 [Sanguibacter gelidistatuariae]